jgi:hypothetical protein
MGAGFFFLHAVQHAGEISKGEGFYIIPASPFLKLPIFCTSVFLVSPLIIRRVKIAME